MQTHNSFNEEARQNLLAKLRSSHGMVAALDQSGGSTPAALAHYGIDATRYRNEDEMFDLIHQMRLRIVTSASFDGDRVLGVILFARTLGECIGSQSIPEYLYGKHQIASFLKIDLGLEPITKGVQLMKPIPNLRETLEWARNLGVIGTKMRTLIHEAPREQVEEAVKQQFALAEEIDACGLVPIVELEVSTHLPDNIREQEECYLVSAIEAALNRSSKDLRVFLKLTLPVVPNLYADLSLHPKVYRILALSGGFSRKDACERLSRNLGIIASFSRAFLEDLRADMSNEEWDAAINHSISEIVQATRTA